MYYNETFTRSMEVLRLTLPQLVQQQASPNPISYAVWYEHVGGRNRRLSEAIAAATREGMKLDDATTLALFRSHVIEADDAATARVNEALQGVMQTLSRSVDDSRRRADDYAADLQRWAEELRRAQDDAASAPPASRVDQILTGTRDVQRTMGDFSATLEARKQEVAALRAELLRAREEALKDTLSGLLNRRGFDEALRRVLGSAQRSGEAMSLVMLDIDHFKRVNDAYGHVVGDRVIRGVGQLLAAAFGSHGMLPARYGGEEFAILMPDCPLDEARRRSERLLATVAGARIRRLDRDESIGQVTVSAGVALARADDEPGTLVDRADQALYVAKRNGRNRVQVEDTSAC